MLPAIATASIDYLNSTVRLFNTKMAVITVKDGTLTEYLLFSRNISTFLYGGPDMSISAGEVVALGTQYNRSTLWSTLELETLDRMSER
jgi:hypothetical protein